MLESTKNITKNDQNFENTVLVQCNLVGNQYQVE